MYIIKNAFKNIGRYKLTYFLFSGFYLILISASVLFINIHIFTQNAIPEIQNYFNSTVIVEQANFQATLDIFSYDDFMYILNTPYVNDIHFNSFAFSPSTLYIDREGNAQWYKLFDETEVFWLSYNGTKKNGVQNLLRHLIITGFNATFPQDFSMVEGRMFENDNEAVVFRNTRIACNDFIYIFSLEIGDTLVFKYGDFYKEYYIVGLLDETTGAPYVPILFTTFNSAEIFNVFPQHLQGSVINTITGLRIFTGYDATIFLRAADDFLALHNKVQWHSNGLYRIAMRYRDTQGSQLNITISIAQISWLVTLVAISFIISLTIIASMIIISNRKYDIAVLRSMGMGKLQLITGQIIENLLFVWGIFIISFALSTVAFIFMLYPWLLQQYIIPLEISILSSALPSLFVNFLLTSIVAILSIVITSIFILSVQPLKLLCNRD
ncbi:MAG: hypothetical protein FWC16_00420 [Defluviitaleaceae bacterium]|nr:hypothetical protein [Defluviitaleaceae bacterium]MCL2273367.1 hypothetical protein [Defluviitaleaceae bacterium]